LREGSAKSPLKKGDVIAKNSGGRIRWLQKPKADHTAEERKQSRISMECRGKERTLRGERDRTDGK